MDAYPKVIRYDPGAAHPIIKVPNSNWIIVDSVGPNWRQIEEGYDPDAPVSLGIHLDADDPTFDFEKNKRRKALSRLHRKDLRLKHRRATDYMALAADFDNVDREEAHLRVEDMIARGERSGAVTIGRYTVGFSRG